MEKKIIMLDNEGGYENPLLLAFAMEENGGNTTIGAKDIFGNYEYSASFNPAIKHQKEGAWYPLLHEITLSDFFFSICFGKPNLNDAIPEIFRYDNSTSATWDLEGFDMQHIWRWSNIQNIIDRKELYATPKEQAEMDDKDMFGSCYYLATGEQLYLSNAFSKARAIAAMAKYLYFQIGEGKGSFLKFTESDVWFNK